MKKEKEKEAPGKKNSQSLTIGGCRETKKPVVTCSLDSSPSLHLTERRRMERNRPQSAFM